MTRNFMQLHSFISIKPFTIQHFAIRPFAIRPSALLSLRRFVLLLAGLLLCGGKVWGQTYYAKTTFTVSPTDAGSISVEGQTTTSSVVITSSTTGDFTWSATSVDLVATVTAKDGYAFSGWTGTATTSSGLLRRPSITPTSSTNNPETFTVKTARGFGTGESNAYEYTVVATFNKYPTATVSVSADPSGYGTVHVSATTTEGTATSATQYYPSGGGGKKTFYLFATPKDGYQFDGWYNGATKISSEANCSVEVQTGTSWGQDNSTSYTAKFSAKPKAVFYYQISAISDPTTGGTIAITGKSANTVYSITGDSWSSTSVSTGDLKFTAAASTDPKYDFIGWSRNGTDIVSTANPYTFPETITSTSQTSPQTVTVYAHFKPVPTFYYTATAAVSTGASAGGGTVSATPKTGTVSGQNGSILGSKWDDKSVNATVEFSATPADHYEFAGWSTSDNGSIESTKNPYSLTVSVTDTVKSTPQEIKRYAVFKPISKLTVQAVASGFGYVYSSETSTASPTLTANTHTTTVYNTDATSYTVYMYAKSTQLSSGVDQYKFKGWSTTGSYDGYYSGVASGETTTIGQKEDKTMYAMFVPYYKLTATAVPVVNGAVSPAGGTVTATFSTGTASTETIEIEGTSSTITQPTKTATFTATPNTADGYTFIGWSKSLGTTAELGSANPITQDVQNTSGSGTTTSLTLYAIFYKVINPSSMTVDPKSLTIDKSATGTFTTTLSGDAGFYKYITYRSSNTTIATVSPASSTAGSTAATTYSSTATVTGVAPGTAKIHVTSFKEGSSTTPTDTAFTDSVTITVKAKLPVPVLTVTPNAGDNYATATVTIAAGADSPSGTKLYYTTDGTEPTESCTEYTASFSLANMQTVKVKAFNNEYWYPSDVVTYQYASRKTATPQVNIVKGSTGNEVNFTCTDDTVTGGIVYYYTTDGVTDPTCDASGNPGTNTYKWDGNNIQQTDSRLSNGCTIKVIATHTGWQNSAVGSRQYTYGSGIYGNSVILNDFEDHNWTYYLPNGGINTAYNYPDKLCSPYPRNVVITYYGNGTNNVSTSNNATPATNTFTAASTTVAVSTTEPQHTFVYYKTLERDANNRFPYELIPNPFSKRPTYGSDTSTKWRGFYKWRVKSVTGGTIYSASSGGTAQAVGALLDAETEYYFQPDNNTYDNANNAISMQVELEAVWARAYRVTCSVDQISTNLSSGTFEGGSVERNFLVVSSGTNSSTAINNTSQKPVTVTMMEPDGSADYRSGKYINPLVIHANADLKFEYIHINAQAGDNVTTTYYQNTGSNSTMIWAGTKNLTLGRGITNTSDGGLTGYNIAGYTSASTSEHTYTSSDGLNYHVRVESGVYNFMTTTQQWTVTKYAGPVKIRATWGCDYDRASGDNTKFIVKRMVLGGNGTKFTSSENKGKETIRQTLKSGTLNSTMEVGGGDMENSTYFGICGWHSDSYTGCRTIILEGGEVSNLCGGSDRDGASIANTDESVRIRIKGGKVRGCVYGGATTTMSIGTRTIIMTGGEVNGWICGGNNGMATGEGELDAMTYVYIGGNAKVDSNNSTTLINRSLGGNVFGAGCGYSSSSTSGRVDLGTNVVVADNSYIERGVYGGGSFGYCDPDKTSNIYITGGHIYGKSGGVASSGTSYDATIQGGVYGGACQNKGGNANVYMTGGVVETGIYGGSNSSGTLSGYTNIHIDGGQIGAITTSANVHGGGYGSSTVVSGKVNVTIGTKDSNANCEYTTAGTAVIYGDVYGGSALGTVNTSRTDSTQVTLNKGTINGSLYGGALGDASNAASVKGVVAVKVYGGSVNRTKVTGAGRTLGSDSYIWGSGGVYGCNNINGTPADSVKVDIYGTDAASSGDYALYSVYGGGNLSAYSGKPTVNIHNCGNSIEYVYGGGNAADVKGADVTIWGGNVVGNVFGGGNGSNTGWPSDRSNWPSSVKAATSNPGANITTDGTAVKIYGGTILNAFGGSNTRGTINGGTSVTVLQQSEPTGCGECPAVISNVYGGGNEAPYTGDTHVTILNGTVGNVFGGGKGNTATVDGDSYVTIGDFVSGHKVIVTDSIYGGGDKGDLTGTTNITIQDCDTRIAGNIYGGGNQATVGATNTTVWGAIVDGQLFGGGCGYINGTDTINSAVGYKTVDGIARTNVYGGSFGGIFGAGNVCCSVEDSVVLYIGEKVNPTSGASACDFSAGEVYGAGNRAEIDCGMDFTLGCLHGKIEELYGGAKAADFNSDINLKITSGRFGKVFGGNNISGTVKGSITVTVDETGCEPVIIDTLYGCGNLAPYTTVNNSKPTINVLSCTRIGAIFGGGYGKTATVTGSPEVNLELLPGAHADKIGNQIGTIGTVYGGGNEAAVNGDTSMKIATTKRTVNGVDTKTDALITGNVYGGGNNAQVSGSTSVQIGPKP